MRGLWACIWALSEGLGIPLGCFAPIVFGLMIGRPGRRVK